MTALEFLLMMPEDAIIVSSDKLDQMQIALARMEGRFFVDKYTMEGWAIVKPESILQTN